MYNLTLESNYLLLDIDTRYHPNKIKGEFLSEFLIFIEEILDNHLLKYWVRLRHEGINASPSSALRTFKRNGAFISYKLEKRKKHKVYHTLDMVHDKWQLMLNLCLANRYTFGTI